MRNKIQSSPAWSSPEPLESRCQEGLVQLPVEIGGCVGILPKPFFFLSTAFSPYHQCLISGSCVRPLVTGKNRTSSQCSPAILSHRTSPKNDVKKSSCSSRSLPFPLLSAAIDCIYTSFRSVPVRQLLLYRRLLLPRNRR